jgi:hypothetical protein
MSWGQPQWQWRCGRKGEADRSGGGGTADGVGVLATMTAVWAWW